jgi:hypothetical protein
MSVESFFFVRDEKLPTISEWQTALNKAGVEIVLEDVGDLRKHTGYLPATHRGRRSGFEWFYGPLADNFGGDPPDGLGGRAHVVNCVTHSDMGELICGLVACSVLSQLADGVFLDEESGGALSADAALEFARGLESQEQERRKRAAEKDAARTSRRCPQCGSPCPEHRKTCKACGFEIGRAV